MSHPPDNELAEAQARYQDQLDDAIDRVLDALENAGGAGVSLDPLQTIMARLRARGNSFDFDELPPLMRMLLEGGLG